MPGCTELLRGLLILQALACVQVNPTRIKLCYNRHYLSGDVCKPCPSQCENCINTTQCTVCQMGYYGQICENKCNTGCTETCHKVYGHCTDGCPDGEFPDQYSLACLNCSNKCKVCRSLTACVQCHTGYYGETCGKRCPEHCKADSCNATDGTCIDCEYGFYKGESGCMLCPGGCADCNDNISCTACSDGFIGPINGMCFLECPTINKVENIIVCNTWLCQNLIAYWKMPHSECQAMSHSSDCFTEGVCVTVNSSILNLKGSMRHAPDYTPLYMAFTCLIECRYYATWNIMKQCEGHVCKGTCSLLKPYGMGDTTPTEQWVKSNCTKGNSKKTDEALSTPVILAIVLPVLVVLVIVIAIVLFIDRKRRLMNEQAGSSTNESVQLTTLANRRLH